MQGYIMIHAMKIIEKKQMERRVVFEQWSPIIHVGRVLTLQWRHNGHDSVSIHQPHDC